MCRKERLVFLASPTPQKLEAGQSDEKPTAGRELLGQRKSGWAGGSLTRIDERCSGWKRDFLRGLNHYQSKGAVLRASVGDTEKLLGSEDQPSKRGDSLFLQAGPRNRTRTETLQRGWFREKVRLHCE